MTFWTIWYRTLGMASSNSHTKLVLVHSFWSDRFENNLHRSINAVNAQGKPNYNDVQRIKAHHNQYRVLLAAVPGFTRVTGKPLSKMLMRLQPATNPLIYPYDPLYRACWLLATSRESDSLLRNPDLYPSTQPVTKALKCGSGAVVGTPVVGTAAAPRQFDLERVDA